MTHGAQALEIGRGGDCSRRRASWLHERRRARVERRDRRGRAAGIEEASAIAEEAYIYGLPLVMNYAAMYDMAVNRDSGQFKAPFNEISSEARVFTPDDTAVIVPNSDTPYSMLSLDLRAERMGVVGARGGEGTLLLGAALRRQHVQLRLHRQSGDG